MEVIYLVKDGYIPVQGGYIWVQGGYIPVQGGYIPKQFNANRGPPKLAPLSHALRSDQFLPK